MSKVVANRYGEALFQIGRDRQQLDTLAEEAGVLQKVFKENEQLVPFLEQPFITYEQKETFIDNVFKAFTDDIRHLLKLLMRRHRTSLVPDIMNQVIHLINEAEGRAEATVYSARALGEKELASLEDTLVNRMNKQAIKLETVVDSSLLGGIKLRVGNRVYDGTVSGKLNRIKRRIKTAES